MTMTSARTSVYYDPDGTQTLFPVPFPLFSPDDVYAVFVDGVTETPLTGYTVEGFGSASGVYVRFYTAPPAGKKLVLYRWTKRVQETDYPEGGLFPSKTVEDNFDTLTAMAQETEDLLQTVIRVPRESAEAPAKFLERFFATAEGAAASRAGAEAAASNAAASAASAAQNVTAAVAYALENAESSASAAHNAAANAAGSATVAAANAAAAAQSAQDAAEYLSDGVPTAGETQKGIVRLATSAEASTGTSDDAAMTPRKTKTVLAALSDAIKTELWGKVESERPGQATETILGIMALATTTEASTGTNDTKAMTPLKTKTVLAASSANLQSQINTLAANKVNYADFYGGWNASGWQRLPNGLIIQWGKVDSVQKANTVVTFPIAFPAACLHCIGTGQHAAGGWQAYVTINFYSSSTATFNCFTAENQSIPAHAEKRDMQVWYLAIGY